jgi:hypothetical protein
MGYTEFVKHLRYKSLYKENELFWGMGIEEETYLQFTKPLYVAAPVMRTCHAAERYSVRYFKNYKDEYKLAFEKLFPDASGFFPIPYFVNAHAFNNMDISGNHKTTYEKVPKPNKRFNGKTFFQELYNFMPTYYCCRPRRFAKVFDESCIFDGDSIEFMTQDFYKTTASSVIRELRRSKEHLLATINTFLIQRNIHREKGLLQYPTENPGFVVNYTNPKNISMFNNGTYHINITLPTELGARDTNRLPRLVDYKKFKSDHKKFIRLIQWLEPFIIGVFGSSDPLSAVSPLYSKGSQRCAVSRYIGLCTYDTNKMPTGKIMTIPVSEIRGNDTPFWWYKQYHSNSGYVMLDELGMDISFRKHYNHGVEIRFLDWFPESMLKEVLEFYVYLADLSLDPLVKMPDEAIMNEEFNNLVVNMLKEGKGYVLPLATIKLYERVLGVSIPTSRPNINGIYELIAKAMRNKYRYGLCAGLML